MPPSEVPMHEFLAALRRHGVVDQPTRSGHIKLRRGGLVAVLATKKGRKVLPVYIRVVRRSLRLDAEHGIDDETFWGR